LSLVKEDAMLTELQKRTAQAIVNIFETGRVQGEYGQVTLLRNDTGHLTYGRAQTTLASGNLSLLIKAYTDSAGAQCAAQLRPYLSRLEDRDLRLDNDMAFRGLLREAGDDPVMHTTQDQFFDRVYWAPSESGANALGISTALGSAVVYDSHIHGSWTRMRDRTTARFGAATAMGERTWVARYVDVRREWLGGHANALLRRTVYRMDAFRQLIAAGNWDLRLPFRVRSLTVTEASLGALQPTPASPGAPTPAPAPSAEPRLLRLRRPFLQGDDVRALQQAVVRAGISTSVDGVFGPGTEQAVKQFQEQHDLTVDGIVGPATRAALESGEVPMRASAEDDAPRLLRLRVPLLQGDDVRAVQHALMQTGARITVDGVFGPGMEQAVKQFQAQHNLRADGIVGPATRAALGL
jgi:chitosanase